MSLKVLMLGWELPPYNSGGLGVACLGMAKSLSQKGIRITFVLPEKKNFHYNFMDIVFANISDGGRLPLAYSTRIANLADNILEEFPRDFISGALMYAEKIREIAMKVKPDVIHAHDWMTLPAALIAKQTTGKPLVTHIHSTEFDRTGGNWPNPIVYAIEKSGLEKSDKIISVSEFTKNILTKHYGIAANKIDVVYNGVDTFHKKNLPPALATMKEMGYKVILYLGRLTLQKGPEYFVSAAKKVLEFEPKTIFVVVGTGDMQEQMMGEAGNLGILDKMMFTGFLRGEEKDRIYQSADLYVMPSVSEPFGITPLEAIANGTPVLISKQSGVSEVLEHALKTDFWDVDEMANKIIGVLRYQALPEELKRESSKELPNINWGRAADKIVGIYNQLG